MKPVKPPSTKPSTKLSKPAAARRGPSGRQNEVVLTMLKKMNLPVTRESYVNLAYFGAKKPEDLTAEEESMLPEELQKS